MRTEAEIRAEIARLRGYEHSSAYDAATARALEWALAPSEAPMTKAQSAARIAELTAPPAEPSP